MKKLLSIIALMLLLSCSKSKPASGSSNANDFYIRFKANGTQLEYRANAEASYNKQTGANYITTLGGTKDQFIPNKSNMTVALTSVGVKRPNIKLKIYQRVRAGLKKDKVLQ